MYAILFYTVAVGRGEWTEEALLALGGRDPIAPESRAETDNVGQFVELRSIPTTRHQPVVQASRHFPRQILRFEPLA